ncbi:MAG: L-aspartate oxidase [Bacteroidia bacterium]|nr:L-aspartate oxidase [Bacteroidia bacterium]
MRHVVDFLVIGSGIAGLTYALKVADLGKVLIITKSNEDESNTKYAQGGIAVSSNDPQSIESHITDTLECGDGLCNEEIVRMTITEGIERLKELIAWGTKFDKNEEGAFDLAKEGGHSENRILHHKDITGKEIERALLEKIHQHPNISIWPHYFSIDLITQHHLGEKITKDSNNIMCFGVYALNQKTRDVDTLLAKKILMAAGGNGQVYRTTTNPKIATGDGVAMTYRAKGKIDNMEFVQFHPTAMYQPNVSPSFLVSEAVRGFGAVLRNHNNEEFMQRYDERGSLAPRDITARAIDNEIKQSGEEYVYLDCTHLDRMKFLDHFPNIYDRCKKAGFDLFEDYIHVAPAAHYMCGGIAVDKNGATSIQNLYATGECSSTGLHGANRLASNSLLEALVFSHRAAEETKNTINATAINENIPDWDAEGTTQPDEMILIMENRRELKAIMSNYVGIVRSNTRLQRALNRLHIIYSETEELYKKTVISSQLCELRNVINVAYLIIKSAQAQNENRGLHYSLDNVKHSTTLLNQ